MKMLLLFLTFSFTLISVPDIKDTAWETVATTEPTDEKQVAFEILQNKCNVCHQKKNKKRVFTIDNMDGYGKKIYKQVFKWKRMPKGNDHQLTPQEYDQLKNWLATLNNVIK